MPSTPLVDDHDEQAGDGEPDVSLWQGMCQRAEQDGEQDRSDGRERRNRQPAAERYGHASRGVFGVRLARREDEPRLRQPGTWRPQGVGEQSAARRDLSAIARRRGAVADRQRRDESHRRRQRRGCTHLEHARHRRHRYRGGCRDDRPRGGSATLAFADRPHEGRRSTPRTARPCPGSRPGSQSSRPDGARLPPRRPEAPGRTRRRPRPPPPWRRPGRCPGHSR